MLTCISPSPLPVTLSIVRKFLVSTVNQVELDVDERARTSKPYILFMFTVS